MAWTVLSWGLESAREVVNKAAGTSNKKTLSPLHFTKPTFSEPDFGKLLEIKEKQELELISHFLCHGEVSSPA